MFTTRDVDIGLTGGGLEIAAVSSGFFLELEICSDEIKTFPEPPPQHVLPQFPPASLYNLISLV